jgi:hypothetical protein
MKNKIILEDINNIETSKIKGFNRKVRKPKAKKAKCFV